VVEGEPLCFLRRACRISLLMAVAGATRVEHLDGIRGWMCAIVLVHHCLLYGPESGRVFYGTVPWVGYVINGRYAVEMFWVVSGYSLACVSTRGRAAPTAVARLPRLSLPFLFMTVVDWVLQPGGRTARRLFETPVQLASYFISGTPLPAGFVHAWTMLVEFRGSILLFAFGSLFQELHQPARLVVPLAAALYFAAPDYLFLLLGFVLKSRPVGASLAGTWTGSALSCLCTAVYFAVQAVHSERALWNWCHYTRCAAVFVSVNSSPHVKRFFGSSLSTFLGRHSFPVYVSHQSIITFLGGLKGFPLLQNPAVFVLCTACASLAASAALLQRVDKKSNVAGKCAAAWVLSEEPTVEDTFTSPSFA